MTASRPESPQRDPRTEEFLRLLGRHERRMLAMIMAMVPDWSAAEDICQEVRIKLWNEFDRYDPTKDFGAWARTIARYEVLSYLKQAKRRHPTFGDDFFASVADEADTLPVDLSDRLGAMRDCLGKVSEANRALLLRYYQRGESLREIAEDLGRSHDATRQMVLRTRKSLAKCIERTLQREAADD